ncbi:MerC domain-containing protein [Sphingomonas sp. DBB INV C78]|uniref:MerC domain-containing protein n=1 Tax=Sphingomonas sp. DBB INV C78 TaxID=3349434 RepID=UPI0036D2C470
MGRGRIRSVFANLIEGTAASASILCLLHCFALPLLLLTLPAALATFALSEEVHVLLLTSVTPFALAAFWIGYQHHGHRVPAALGVAGIGCLAAGISPFPPAVQTFLTVVGSLLLFAGHLRNWRLRVHAA